MISYPIIIKRFSRQTVMYHATQAQPSLPPALSNFLENRNDLILKGILVELTRIELVTS